jgi:hypothetical protein
LCFQFGVRFSRKPRSPRWRRGCSSGPSAEGFSRAGRAASGGGDARRGPPRAPERGGGQGQLVPHEGVELGFCVRVGRTRLARPMASGARVHGSAGEKEIVGAGSAPPGEDDDPTGANTASLISG